MNILLISAAALPFAKPTPTSELCSSLPRVLKSLGHQVTLVLPMVQSVDIGALSLARRLSKIEVEIDGEKLACELYTGRHVSGVELVFLGHESEIRGREEVSTAHPRSLQIFGRAAAGYVKTVSQLDVVHAVGAAGIIALSAMEREVRSVLTLPEGLHFDGMVLPVDAVARNVRFIAALSESTAATLRARWPEAEVRAIPSGVDAAVWNPVTDERIVARFDPHDLYGRDRCREALQASAVLPVRHDAPVFLVDGTEPAAAAVREVLPDFLRNDVQVVVVAGATAEQGAQHWSDDCRALTSSFLDLAKRWPDRVSVQLVGDAQSRDAAFHPALAGADFLVCPSSEADSATDVLRAQRYGVLPMVRAKGAQGEAVIDVGPELDSGTGFSCGEGGVELLAVMQRGATAFARTTEFTLLRRRVMKLDPSWERTARQYDRLFELSCA